LMDVSNVPTTVVDAGSFDQLVGADEQ
jgi:hypothetical protein